MMLPSIRPPGRKPEPPKMIYRGDGIEIHTGPFHIRPTSHPHDYKASPLDGRPDSIEPNDILDRAMPWGGE
jgi:hypothetical protein